jgi:hypothetical protein
MALDLSAPKSPPAKPQQKAAPKTTPGVAKPKEQINQERLGTCVETIEGIAGIAAMFGAHADAGLLMMHGGGIATTAVEMGEEYEKVGDVIDILGKNSAWVKVFGLAMVIGGQFAVNHGWIKNPDRMAGAGIVTPDTLIAMSKTKLAEIEMQARQAQMEAEMKRQAIQRQYESMQQQLNEMNNEPVGV